MARQTITGIWANAAAGDKITAPSTDKLNNGWVSEKPSFRIFNWFWQKITNMIQNAEKYGIMEWSAETLYPIYGLALAPATGIVYKSKQANNLNHAVTDTDWWERAFNLDISYAPVSAHTTTVITQTLAGTYTYSIAGFSGSGLVPANIRALHISVNARVNWDSSAPYSLSASFPDGTSHVIFGQSDRNGGDDESHRDYTTVSVPINPGQTSVVLSFVPGNGGTFTIIGATQRVF